MTQSIGLYYNHVYLSHRKMLKIAPVQWKKKRQKELKLVVLVHRTLGPCALDHIYREVGRRPGHPSAPYLGSMCTRPPTMNRAVSGVWVKTSDRGFGAPDLRAQQLAKGANSYLTWPLDRCRLQTERSSQILWTQVTVGCPVRPADKASTLFAAIVVLALREINRPHFAPTRVPKQQARVEQVDIHILPLSCVFYDRLSD